MSKLNAIACLALALSLAACGPMEEETKAPEGECELTEAQECECPVGPAGLAICEPDDNTWGACDCPPPPTNGLPVTVDDKMWQTTLGPSLTPGPAAAYCANDTEAGYTDWHLPSKREFEALFDDCHTLANGFIVCDGPCNDPAFCSKAPATWYRTSTPAGNGMHYVVHLGDGFITPLSDAYSVSTLCVRDLP